MPSLLSSIISSSYFFYSLPLSRLLSTLDSSASFTIPYNKSTPCRSTIIFHPIFHAVQFYSDIFKTSYSYRNITRIRLIRLVCPILCIIPKWFCPVNRFPTLSKSLVIRSLLLDITLLVYCRAYYVITHQKYRTVPKDNFPCKMEPCRDGTTCAHALVCDHSFHDRRWPASFFYRDSNIISSA